MDSFSFHRFFGETNRWEAPIGQRWALGDLLAYVEGLGTDVLSLQTIHVADKSAPGISALRDELGRIGVACIYAWGHRNGLENGRSPEKLADALAAMRAASELGCRTVRVVCGDQDSWSSDRGERGLQISQLRAPLADIGREAERLGLVVAVENHADRPVADVVDLVAGIGSAHVGICLDVGNAVRVGDDPVEAVEAAAPWIVMTHLRDLRTDGASPGDPAGWWPCVALGEGDLDIPGILGALQRAPRCDDWVVEISNVLPRTSELAVLDASLAYLRARLTARA